MSSSLVFTMPSTEVLAEQASLQAQDDLVLTLPWRALAIVGADAETFLQGQVTTDIREVTATQSRLACLLNLKGRVQYSGRLLAWPEGYLLLLPAEQFDAARARLAKYGVFSKITLSEVSLRIQGILGQGAHDRLASLGLALPALPALEQGSSGLELPIRIRLPGQARGLLLSMSDEAAPLTDSPLQPQAAASLWDTASIIAGEWTLAAVESELFQPQEMDYHALQGVSYQKGCYLGQEIVARLYFRGQLKTELSAWHCEAGSQSLAAGMSLLSDDGSRVGEVIRAVAQADGHWLVLAQSKRDVMATQLQADALYGLERLPFER